MTMQREISPEKAELIERSQLAKELRKMWIDDAGSGDKALWAASLKVNDVLLILYKEETGEEDFKTF